ncbi:MAG: class I SAM-dependent methyltransferase [Thermofilaceae archaeon]
MNEEIYNSVKLSGIVIDIGGGKQPSYQRLLFEKSDSITFHLIILDIVPDINVNVVGSITHLPFRSSSVNYILCFNVLEHVFDYALALAEIWRVLKPNGILYGRVPFLFGIHEDPYDYWRYTKKTLEEILYRANFTEISIKTHGGLFLVILNLINPFLKISIIKVICAIVAITMNYLCSIIIGDQRNHEKYPIGYFFSARKQLKEKTSEPQ